jgi:5-methylcytosine-specific restriction endonuclease McrA
MTQYKACCRCGKIHPSGYKCRAGVSYKPRTDYEENRIRHTKAWEHKREEVKEKASGLCEVCRDRGAYTYVGLEVHHIEKIRDRPDLSFDNSNLICLCRLHHRMAELGQLGKDYLRDLARRREET